MHISYLYSIPHIKWDVQSYIHTEPTGLSLLAPVVGIFTFIACVSKHFYSHKMSFHVVWKKAQKQTTKVG